VRVIYSIGARVGGGGIGTTAYHGVRGLQRHGMLQRLLCGSCRATDIPRERIRALGLPSRVLRKLAVYDASKHLQRWHSALYDRWGPRIWISATSFWCGAATGCARSSAPADWA
jgi:hypothetical protein